MKSYLQRLAARATGHTVTPSLIPAVRNEVIGQSEPDPFAAALESDESAAAQSPQAVNGPQATSTRPYSSETVEPPAPTSPRDRSRRIQRSSAAKAPEKAIETQPVSPRFEGATRQQEMSSREIDSPAISEGERRRSRDKTRVRAERATTQRAQSEEKGSPLLSPVKAGEQPFTRESKIGAEDVPQQLTPRAEATVRSTPASSRAIPADVTDESAQTLEPRRADAVRSAASVSGLRDEPAPTLEPRRVDEVRTATPIPDEPRLVIGQLRVDVVAAAPAQPREVVRVVTRTVGAGRGSNTGSSLSKLRFGLGQM